jgi:hypothetical protein
LDCPVAQGDETGREPPSQSGIWYEAIGGFAMVFLGFFKDFVLLLASGSG